MSPAPASVHAEVATVLTTEPEHRREEFAIRLDHWWDDLVDGLRTVYPSPSADELIEWCRGSLARFKCPRHIVFAELPKTSTGKVQKFILRDMARKL